MARTQQQALTECLRALDGGASVEACLARFPEAEPLRPYLALRERLLALEFPEAPAAAYASGRQALLRQLAQPATPAASGFMTSLRATFAGGWQSRLVRAATAAAFVFALVGGGLGVSAAAGVDRAHDVLSALHIVAPAANEQRPPAPTPGAATPSGNGGQKNVPGAVDEGRPTDGAATNSNAPGGGSEENGPCQAIDPNASPGSQTLASPCTPAESEGSAVNTPEPNEGNASDHPTPGESQETPHNPSGGPGEGSHPEDPANATPGPEEHSGSREDSDGGATEQPAHRPPDEHANP